MLSPRLRLALLALVLCLPFKAGAETISAPGAVSPTPSALSPTTGAVCAVPTPPYNVLLTGTGTIAAEGGPGGKIAFLPSGPALLSGGIGVLSLPYGLGLGVGAYSLSSEYVPTHNGVKYDLGYTYGGVVLAYSMFTHSLISVIATAMVGPGQGWAIPREPGASRTYSNYLQIEPGFNIMLNVTRELSIGFGGSWSFCEGADLQDELGSNLGGGGVSFLVLVGQD
jgi:hypothetical protein